MSITVEAVPIPTPDERDHPSPALVEVSQVYRALALHTLGFDDLVDSPEALSTAYSEQSYRRKQMLLARDSGRAVGAAYLGLPLRDNLTVVEGDMAVLPGEDHAVVADALWEAVLAYTVSQQRRTVQLWTAHAAPAERTQDDGAPGADAWVVPATGIGRVPRDLDARALMRWGFRLEQAERHSVLDVHAAQPDWKPLEDEAQRAARGYETLTWVGPIPPEHHEQMAAIMARMSLDVPSGEFDLEEESWDAARVADQDRVGEAMGRLRVTTVARHQETGEFAAYTYLVCPRDHPQVAYQEDTLVHGDHRGNRLGMLVKVRTLRELMTVRPQVARVHTWNAGENEHMLSINVALGFAETSLEGGWQYRLPAAQS